MGKTNVIGGRNADRENFSAFVRAIKNPQKRKIKGRRRKTTEADLIAGDLEEFAAPSQEGFVEDNDADEDDGQE